MCATQQVILKSFTKKQGPGKKQLNFTIPAMQNSIRSITQNIKKIKSIRIPKQKGKNLNPGIWHFPIISTKDMNFLVLDRKGKGNNLIIHKFMKEKIYLSK